MLTMPDAMEAQLGDFFWRTLALALSMAFGADFCVNRRLISPWEGGVRRSISTTMEIHHGDERRTLVAIAK